MMRGENFNYIKDNFLEILDINIYIYFGFYNNIISIK
jgi:hypothetical protein